MKKSKNIAYSILTVILSIFLVISIVIIAGFTFLYVTLINDSKNLDDEYALFKATGNIESRVYQVDENNSLDFFVTNSDFTDGYKFTQFIAAMPELNVVGDDEYYIEITTNNDMFDLIDIYTDKDTTVVDFKNEYYNKVSDKYVDDYDWGLYVECSEFKVTVHAPIHNLESDVSGAIIDFCASKCEKNYVSVEDSNGIIYNIQTGELYLDCAGNSDIKLVGKVEGKSNIYAYHNSHIDASELESVEFENRVSRGFGGFSYIKFDKWYKFHCNIIGGPTNIISFVIFAFPVIWGYLLVKLLKERKKNTKEIFVEDASDVVK